MTPVHAEVARNTRNAVANEGQDGLARHLSDGVSVSTQSCDMRLPSGQLTRSGGAHMGVILFRRSVSQMDYGKQSRLVLEFWREERGWDWSDRIEYLPRMTSMKLPVPAAHLSLRMKSVTSLRGLTRMALQLCPPCPER